MTTIILTRNRIAFENLAFCECGNGDMHQREAIRAWLDEVVRVVEDAGFSDDSKIKSENNPSAMGIYIEVEREIRDEDGDYEATETCLWTDRVKAGTFSAREAHCITEGHYEDAPSNEVVRAMKVAEDADTKGMEAAEAAYKADCSEYERAEVEA